MKLVSSLLSLFFCVQIFASQMIVVSFKNQRKSAELIKKMLVREYNLPGQVIKLDWRENPCQIQSSPLLHICVDQTGDMHIQQFKRSQFNQSFELFLVEMN